MSDEKDMATKESLFSLIERIEKLEQWKQKSWNMHQELAQDILPNYVEQEISELEEQIAKSISITQFKVEKEKLWERINQLDEEFYKKTEELEKKLDDHINWSINEERIEKLEDEIDRCFKDTNANYKEIAELKEKLSGEIGEIEQNRREGDFPFGVDRHLRAVEKQSSISDSKPEELNEIHREYEKGLKEGKWLEYPPRESAEDMAKIEQIIQIYDNGHENVFYPDKYVLVAKEKLERWYKLLEEVYPKIGHTQKSLILAEIKEDLEEENK